jgi:hypothetical protein
MSRISTIARGGLIAIALASLGAASANAASPDAKPADHSRNCFFITQWRGWKAPAPDVLYLGVNNHDVYKVQLSSGTPELQWPDAHLISRTRGSDTVCDALDLDLSLYETGGIRMGLIAKSIVKLTPDEVAAIPPKYRPN